MTEDFNLSDKIPKTPYGETENFMFVEDVKKFIKRLKDELSKFQPKELLFENSAIIINKLAGDKLI